MGKNVYYTDDYNNPRLFKYRGLIEQDGALNFNNNKHLIIPPVATKNTGTCP